MNQRMTGTMTGMVLAATVGLLVACQATPSSTTQPETRAAADAGGVAMSAINDKCPVRGGDVPADAATVEYRGYRVGFCCPGCISQWEAKSAAEKDQFIARYLD